MKKALLFFPLLWAFTPFVDAKAATLKLRLEDKSITVTYETDAGEIINISVTDQNVD